MNKKTLRELREDLEIIMLSPQASFSIKSSRLRPEKPCPVRTEYQRDRDRILYSKAFRRLMHKTQVFIAPEGDHYRTRLTHTLEVSQIARTIARALRLNEDLTEAISLGHDLGHAPFGHAGESALNYLMQKYSGEGFHHSKHSLRVVDYLEKEGGLNLTLEVRNGIISHTKGRKKIGSCGVFEEPMTLEAEVVRIADRLAYINHDIDDAVRAGIISPGDIPLHLRKLFGNTVARRVHAMVMDIVEFSQGKEKILQSPEVAEGVESLKEFLYKKVYENSPAKREDEKTKILIKQLFEHLMTHPSLIPGNVAEHYNNGFIDRELFRCSMSITEEINLDSIEDEERKLRARKVCDFIAGMSDRYAIAMHKALFVPQGWNLEVMCRNDSKGKD